VKKQTLIEEKSVNTPNYHKGTASLLSSKIKLIPDANHQQLSQEIGSISDKGNLSGRKFHMNY